MSLSQFQPISMSFSGGSKAPPPPLPPPPLILDQTVAQRAKKVSLETWPPLYEGMDPPLLFVAISFVLFFLLEASLLLISVPLFPIPKKHKALYTKNLESGGHSI